VKNQAFSLAKAIYPPNIGTPHLKDLEKSEISREEAMAAGITTVPPKEISKILAMCNHGWASSRVESMLAFPYPPVNGSGDPGYFRVKVYPAIETEKGTAKYLQPAGSTNHLYFPPGVDPKGHDPLYITEGEKKSYCLTLQGFPCIGLGGVWGWKQDGKPIADLDAINWKRRDVIIVFDADIEVNEGVAQAESKLAEELISRKARVFVKRLPYGPNCSKGADDFILAHGIEEFKKLKIKAIKPKKSKSASGPSGVIDRGLRLTDKGAAERMIAQHGPDLRYCYPWKKWLVFDGKRWAPDSTGAVFRCAKNVSPILYAEAAAAKDKEERKALAQFAIKCESADRQRAFLTSAQSEPDIPVLPEHLDGDPWLLNVLNGTIDLRTGDLRAHNRADMITKLVPVEYDQGATCPFTWLSFLQTVLAGNAALIKFLQKAIGYALTGSTREQSLFFLYGLGANGKSTLLDIILRLLADYGKRTSGETFLVKKGGQIPNDIAALRGARFVAAVEVESGRRLAEVLIKEMTGGDTISARFLHAEFFEFKPEFKIFLAANHKPVIRGTDHAIWRRVHLIPFDVQIPEEQQDKELPAKLQAELPGILNWAIEGCLLWQREGLMPPQEVTEATEGYREEMDPISDFIAECCIVAPGASVKAKELYGAYTEWAEDNKEKKPLSLTAFGLTLTDRGFQKGRGSAGVWFRYGIGLKVRE
jgi:putative DNA primase/helicase